MKWPRVADDSYGRIVTNRVFTRARVIILRALATLSRRERDKLCRWIFNGHTVPTSRELINLPKFYYYAYFGPPQSDGPVLFVRRHFGWLPRHISVAQFHRREDSNARDNGRHPTIHGTEEPRLRSVGTRSMKGSDIFQASP